MSNTATSVPPVQQNETSTPEAASVRRSIAELERAFHAFGDLAFRRKMPMPVITIQTKGRKRVVGWFSKERWQNGQPKKLPEINLCAEHLAEGLENIAEVLLHEMCHLANYLDGVCDCSTSQYHNRHFKRRCESIRLTCQKGPRGWAYTELSPELREIVRQVSLDPEAFKMYRAGAEYRLATAQPERRFRRYTCPCEEKVIWASRGLDATCNLCLKVYVESPLAGAKS